MAATNTHLVMQENGVLIPNELFGQNELLIGELQNIGVLTKTKNGSGELNKKRATDLKPMRRVPVVDLSREFQWLKEHQHEYIGKWVLVEGDQLINVSDTGKEAYAAADAAGIKTPFVHLISPDDFMPFGGW